MLDYNWMISSGALGLGAAIESILLSLALADRIRNLQEEQRLTQLSMTDELTGLYNKRLTRQKNSRQQNL